MFPIALLFGFDRDNAMSGHTYSGRPEDQAPAWRRDRKRRRAEAEMALERTSRFLERVRRAKRAVLSDMASVRADMLESEQIVAELLAVGEDARALGIGNQLKKLEQAELELARHLERLESLRARLERVYELRSQRSATYTMLDRKSRQASPVGKALA